MPDLSVLRMRTETAVLSVQYARTTSSKHGCPMRFWQILDAGPLAGGFDFALLDSFSISSRGARAGRGT